MSYVIESNIPAPTRRDGTLSDALGRMLPGDSLLINKNSLGKVYDYGKEMGVKFTTSTKPQFAPDGKVRVWMLRRAPIASVKAA
jgi:hypothetical protein